MCMCVYVCVRACACAKNAIHLTPEVEGGTMLEETELLPYEGKIPSFFFNRSPNLIPAAFVLLVCRPEAHGTI